MEIVDSHCHVSRPLTTGEITNIGKVYEQNGVAKVVVMSSNHIDGLIVYNLAQHLPAKVIPSIGIHPWYTHVLYVGDKPVSKMSHYCTVFQKEVDEKMLSILPEPMDFHEYFDKMLNKFIDTFGLEKVVIGEIGLDKLAKVPTNGYYGREAFEGRLRTENVKLSVYKTSMDHQRAIFTIQVQKAMMLGLPMSIHCVKAMSHIIEIFQKLNEKPTKSRLMLHSYTGSIDSLKLLLKHVDRQQVYISLSSLLNQSRLEEFTGIINPDHILMESDVSIQKTEFQLKLLKEISVLVSDPVRSLDKFLSRP